MKKLTTYTYIIYTFLMCFTVTAFSQNQTAFQNFGNVQMHANANVGFHTHLVNEGTFDKNLGFTGFYSTTEVLTVSGTNRPVFHNIEIDVVNNLELQVSMGITNELQFLFGKVITPRDQLEVNLDFINHDFYIGEGNTTHVDGYATVTGFDGFVFPIGDTDRLRPMIIPNRNVNTILQGAYFDEDPNLPTYFSDDFNTTVKEFKVETVSTYEFWDLNGTSATKITLTWDSLSNVNLIAPDISQITVVGWNITNNRWEDLGNINMTGDANSGTVTSIDFIPNNYEIITLGSIGAVTNNYNISPNGDDATEFLDFEELDQPGITHNELVIFNRWGNIVYSKKDYNNRDFIGISNGRATIAKESKLPAGTYFYELKYGETENLNEFKTGWVYINR